MANDLVRRVAAKVNNSLKDELLTSAEATEVCLIVAASIAAQQEDVEIARESGLEYFSKVLDAMVEAKLGVVQ